MIVSFCSQGLMQAGRVPESPSCLPRESSSYIISSLRRVLALRNAMKTGYLEQITIPSLNIHPRVYLISSTMILLLPWSFAPLYLSSTMKRMLRTDESLDIRRHRRHLQQLPLRKLILTASIRSASNSYISLSEPGGVPISVMVI